VAGERIDSFCRARALPVAERLKLFLQVAGAVAHAHAHLVVHRDLKPANILVTDRAGVFEVKLLDFGIAKLLQDDAHGGGGGDSALTRDAGRPLTPDYASPEQRLGQPIGTASDIYSLGLLLFELLAGVHPRRAAASGPASADEAFERGDLPRPSALAPVASRRLLSGDLDTIVLKALKQVRPSAMPRCWPWPKTCSATSTTSPCSRGPMPGPTERHASCDATGAPWPPAGR
jgi:eukaryotic-like serine/threonine-protein kinase